MNSKATIPETLSILKIGLDFQTGVYASFAIVLYLYLKHRKNASRLPLPPGPKKLPLVGNLLDMPKSYEWLTFQKWAQELGSDIIHLNMAGTSIVVLDSEEAANDLLEKRSSLYSSRARMPMVNELMGWSFNLGSMPYGDSWREHRRCITREFHPNAAARFQPHVHKATHGLLRRLLDEHDDVLDSLRQMAGETIMSVAYGLDVQEKEDPYILAAQRGTGPLTAAAVPGAFLVDALPILKYVPEWMPFAGFQRKAKEWRKCADTMLNLPYDAAMRNIKAGEYTPSFLSYSLENIDEKGDAAHQNFVIKNTAGSMFIAGSDTTVSAIGTCILGLLSNPEAFKKAREEIDRVIGTERLPNFKDEESLPYITAVMKEGLRWRVVGPISQTIPITHKLFAKYHYQVSHIILKLKMSIEATGSLRVRS
ncbi:hypothetical protein H0H81_002159 [Sphagnurus paluster]|uniref:Cytochrome P450 n=1 Tax=Sphagnurus paluster TaxID=117069 RepID=A0A9P7K6E5_9AGAR|nr:hypothetical protein H0H81_002159 [Sphagnurus paluster]